MPSVSPTWMNGMPASSSSLVIGKSYAVSAAIFSCPFIARMSSTVIFLGFMPDKMHLTALETRQQFLRRRHRRADLAHHDAGGVVGKNRRFHARSAARNCQRERRNHRVARAGNVEHVLRLRRNV